MSFFSKNLRFLRESRGLKLDEFECIGIKKGTMSNYELGNTEPKLNLLCEISKFFGISIDDLLLQDIEVQGSSPMVATERTPIEVTDNFKVLLDMLREKDLTITTQAEEIGVLKQTIVQLEREKERFVSDANDSMTANAG